MGPRTVRKAAGDVALRLAIIGLGAIGTAHARAWSRVAGVTLVGAVDPSPERVVWARAHGLAVFRSCDALAGQVDAAVVSAPSHLHRSCAEPLLEAGVHCLVEKPLALEAQDCASLCLAAGRGGALLAVGHCERFNAGVRRVRLALRRGVRDAEVVRVAPLEAEREVRGDVVQDLMVHDLDWLMEALGCLPTGIEVREVRRRGDALEHVRCELAFPGGRRVALTASRMGPVRRREATLHGADGARRTVRLDLGPWDPPDRDPLTLQARAFLRAVRGRTSRVATGEEALRAMSLCDEIRARCRKLDAAA